MSRKKRSASPISTSSNAVPAAQRPTLPPPCPPRPRKWLLIVSLALLAAWITFLLYLALHARRIVG